MMILLVFTMTWALAAAGKGWSSAHVSVSDFTQIYTKNLIYWYIMKGWKEKIGVYFSWVV